MLRKAIILQAVVLILQTFLPSIVQGTRSYGCMEGYCAMSNCRSSSGSGWSNYCWIAADSAGNYIRCGGKEDCRGAALSWGNCKAGSCQFDRAPDPYKSPQKTCERMNAKKVNDLKTECRSYSFDKWTRDYNTPRKLYTKFEPCVGEIIEGETKKVIKYCHCYNSCGKTQTDNGDCEVQGLDRRLDFEADTKTTYHPVCKIDCEPVDKYVFLAALKHGQKNTASLKVTITKGMTSTKTTSSGGSSSLTVSGEVGVNVLNIFSAKLGVSGTTGFDWSSSSSSNSFQQRSYEISVPVDQGDEVNVYQVIGECENSDGTKYTVETTKYETRDKGGKVLTTSEVPADE